MGQTQGRRRGLTVDIGAWLRSSQSQRARPDKDLRAGRGSAVRLRSSSGQLSRLRRLLPGRLLSEIRGGARCRSLRAGDAAKGRPQPRAPSRAQTARARQTCRNFVEGIRLASGRARACEARPLPKIPRNMSRGRWLHFQHNGTCSPLRSIAVRSRRVRSDAIPR